MLTDNAPLAKYLILLFVYKQTYQCVNRLDSVFNVQKENKLGKIEDSKVFLLRFGLHKKL